MAKPRFLDTLLLKQAAQQFRAVNHPLRQKMLHLLHNKGPLMVTDIWKTLRIDQPVASNQLALLRKAGIVTTQRQGQAIFYAINDKSLQTLHSAAAMVVNLGTSKNRKNSFVK
ncbi:MAG TPA: metalloregulator ArsR/SmtB family transcription factor [Flavisolibacter sp.]|nr:metalloregulator ArsR/SmtB family transcription factor [Flavisolibacter sp.]